MRERAFIIIIIVFLQILSGKAQNTLVKTKDINFQTGLELLDKKKYGAVREFFERYMLEHKNELRAIDAEYYVAFAALNLFNPDAEVLFENFIKKYPYHNKSSSAYYDLGTFYYNNKKYDKTIEYLQKVNFSQLSEPQSVEAKFRMAYSFFSQKDFEKAGPLFNQIKSYNHKYTYASSYYAAYIEYRNNEYELALNDLKKAEESEAYKNLVPLMIINIYYKANNFNKMLNYSEEVLSRKDKVQGIDEIMLLSGEAAYNNRNYPKATDYLRKYMQEAKSKATPDVMYRYAYSLFKTEQFNEAASNFKIIAGGKDSLSQAAAYYLGLSYLKLDNKPYAFASFDQARKATTYPSIREESLFNFAKVSFELEKYSESLQALKEFSKTVSRSEHEEEVQELFSEALLRTNNYSEGLGYIENLKSRSLRVNTAFQRIAFYRGSELFNSDKFEEAIQLFDKSINYSFDKDVYLAANFWKGEAYSILKDYNSAINAYAVVFQKSLPNDSDYHLKTRYGIGYAYYNTKQYEKALQHFKEYVNAFKNQSQKQNLHDATLRLADVYFVTKQYSEAIKYYDLAINESNIDKDYAYFQKGIVLGLSGNLPEAIKNFNIVINTYHKSLFYDDAIFQKAELELENSNYFASIQGFTTIIQSWPSGGFVPYSYLKRAVAYSNVQKFKESIADFKIILEKFPEHPVANDALLGLQEAVGASGEAEDLTMVIAKYKEINPKSDALINIEFENAKLLYNNQKYIQAIEAFLNYQKEYPQSPNNSEAGYYLGESYFRNKDFINALGQYKIIVQDKSFSFYSKAVQRIAEIEFNNQSFTISKNYYQILLETAKNKKERFNAWVGLMECYFNLKNYDSSFLMTKTILENGNATIDAENKALLYQGKIAFSQKKYDESTDYLLNTINNAKDENAAEAQFLLAKIQAEKKLLKQSNETLFDLNNNFAAYSEWLGKSYLLIAENYIQLNEIFQAKATLSSIIEKSPHKDIVDQAKTILNDIEKLKTTENLKLKETSEGRAEENKNENSDKDKKPE